MNDVSKSLTRSQVDDELARMATMTPEAAAAAAARAVAEAEAIMAEAEAAAREAEVAEAEAQAAQAFAEVALLTWKNRNAAKLVSLQFMNPLVICFVLSHVVPDYQVAQSLLQLIGDLCFLRKPHDEQVFIN